MKRWKALLSLLMLAVWLPATSHQFLESIGVIHEEGVPGSDSNHAAADGLILLPPSVNAPAMSATLLCVPPLVAFLLPEPVETRPTHRIGSGTSPPLPNIWQFIHRAALPARAPSFAS